jgi:hypothetical protein
VDCEADDIGMESLLACGPLRRVSRSQTRRPNPAGDDRSQTEAHAVCCLRPGAGHGPRGCISHRAGRVQLLSAIKIDQGKHSYEFDYTLPETR